MPTAVTSASATPEGGGGEADLLDEVAELEGAEAHVFVGFVHAFCRPRRLGRALPVPLAPTVLQPRRTPEVGVEVG